MELQHSYHYGWSPLPGDPERKFTTPSEMEAWELEQLVERGDEQAIEKVLWLYYYMPTASTHEQLVVKKIIFEAFKKAKSILHEKQKSTY